MKQTWINSFCVPIVKESIYPIGLDFVFRRRLIGNISFFFSSYMVYGKFWKGGKYMNGNNIGRKNYWFCLTRE